MLADEILDAHGGRERWAATRAIRAQVRCGGLLLRTRLPGNRFREGWVEASVDRVRSTAGPFPRQGRRGVFENGAVRIESDEGQVVASRSDPRPCFSGLSGVRRNLRWDALDATYFAGYAWWNYLNVPFLFVRDGVASTEGEPLRQAGEIWRRLDVIFPVRLDTHSPKQSFFYDREMRLRRHDYVAEVVGGWARAAHMCADHVEVGGMVFPTRRWVRPIGPRGRPLPGPTLVSLRLLAIEVDPIDESGRDPRYPQAMSSGGGPSA